MKPAGRPLGSKDGPTAMIDKGVPIPRTVRELYPWRNMEVGDSLFLRNRMYWEVNPMRWKAQKRHGIKLVQRKVDGGVRIWRVE